MIPIKEMAKIGSFDTQIGKTGNYEIWIYNREGDGTPHFHIINEENGFSCCVRILEADYFLHTGKEDTLTTKLRKSLDTFLRKPHRKNKNVTNWEYLCMCWDDNNSNYELPDDIGENQPDYTKLP